MLAHAGSSKPTTAGTAIHSEYPTDKDAEHAARVAAAEKEPLRTATIEETQPTTLFASSLKLKKVEIGSRGDPSFQQKCNSQGKGIISKWTIEEVSCVGVDGDPIGNSSGVEADDDYKEYFKDHRPSPISEIEVADTRFPIIRATAGGADDDDVNYDVVGWKEEQLDTAEEALRRGHLLGASEDGNS